MAYSKDDTSISNSSPCDNGTFLLLALLNGHVTDSHVTNI